MMKLYVMENGKLVGAKTNSIADADPDEMQTAPIWSVLIDHPDGYVLFDAGCHTDESRQLPFIYRDFSMEPEDHIALRLAAIGVRPEEIKHVVISHLHSDHTGFIELFPNAKLYVHEDEFAQRYKQNEQSDDSNGGDMAFWLSQNLTWIKLFQAGTSGDEFELLPGLTILNFGSGHSYGMLGLLINLPKTGKIILASDAVYNRENVGPPVKVAGNMYDRDGFISTIEKVTAYADKIGAQLWYGHDEPQFAALTKSPNGYYE